MGVRPLISGSKQPPKWPPGTLFLTAIGVGPRNANFFFSVRIVLDGSNGQIGALDTLEIAVGAVSRECGPALRNPRQ